MDEEIRLCLCSVDQFTYGLAFFFSSIRHLKKQFFHLELRERDSWNAFRGYDFSVWCFVYHRSGLWTAREFGTFILCNNHCHWLT